MATKETILRAGLNSARKHGLYTMTRRQVAKTAKVSPALISHYFENMPALRGAVISEAIARCQFMDVLATALGARDPVAMKAPAEIKREALKTIA